MNLLNNIDLLEIAYKNFTYTLWKEKDLYGLCNYIRLLKETGIITYEQKEKLELLLTIYGGLNGFFDETTNENFPYFFPCKNFKKRKEFLKYMLEMEKKSESK